MAEGRPDIPAALKRAVLVEAGHRCAIPTCTQTPVELAHITPWATAQEHVFENLIALCPTCHARYDRGEMDRLSMQTYKANLGVLTGRYCQMELRLLHLFASNLDSDAIDLDAPMHFELMNLVTDGLIVHVPWTNPDDVVFSIGKGGQTSIPTRYALTDQGVAVVRRIAQASPIDG